jgi:hypothetical protein
VTAFFISIATVTLAEVGARERFGIEHTTLQIVD